MKNLYRRYRPLKLADVVGQEQIVNVLKKTLKQQKLNHAYLFVGPRGTGKTSVARIFAHAVNDFDYQLEDSYVDIIEIDGASNRGIDDIRELREKANIAPTAGKYKVYIIDEVHMLTKEAFNALLKTLEEPPAHVIFIMATTDAYKVPVTITSRAQTFTFKLADAETIFKFIKSVAKQEKIKITDEALKIIAKRGGGSFRDTLSLLDQISTLSDQEIDQDLVVKAMGLPSEERIADLLTEYIDGDLIEITKKMRALLATGIKPETVAEEMIRAIIEEPRTEWLPLLKNLPEVKDPFAEAKLLLILAEKHLKDVPVGAGTLQPSSRYSSLHDLAATSALPQETVPKQSRTQIDSFDWDDFLATVQSKNDVVYSQLKHCEHELKNGELHLYPRTKIVKNILESKNNKKILLGVNPDLGIKIHPAGEHPELYEKDETLSKISAIMGGEVLNDGGNSPF